MSKNTSVALGTHFEEFAKNRIEEGRYKNISEVIRAGLRLLEDEEQKFVILRNAIKEGIESGVAANFDSENTWSY
ncbi:MAG: type II toxin-antitoxin system ParD family antitoxin [Saprospiraceae bacterium]|nr:type II toxin-antitoxin system ParD family antitoxin [Saprospiraceae bacterium]